MSSDTPADEFPILKIGLDPNSPNALTDVTDEVDEIHFRARRRYPFGAHRRARNPLGPRDDVRVDLLEVATLRLRHVRLEAARLALRGAALDGARMPVEFYPDGDRPGALRISASCLVTSVSIRAYGAHSLHGLLWQDDDDEPKAWRDDDLELTFTSGATYERIEQRPCQPR